MIFNKNIVIIIICFVLAGMANSAYGRDITAIANPRDTAKIIQLIDSAGALMNSNPGASGNLLEEAIIISNELKFPAGKARSLNTLGILAYQKGMVDSARYYFEESLKQWRQLNDKKQIASLLGNLSVILAQQNQLAKAIEYNKMSLEVKLELQDTIPIANGYNNLGNLYMDIGNTKEALYFQHKSLKLRMAIKDSARLPACYINIGDIYNSIGVLDSAHYYGEKALSLQKRNNNRFGMANSYGVLAEFHYLKDSPDSALIYVNKSLDLAREVGFTPLLEEMTILKTNVLLGQQKVEEALLCASSLQTYEDPRMNISYLRILAQIYQKKRENKKAAFYYKRLSQLNDSLQEMNQRNRISDITANHFYELQELELKNRQELEANSLQLIVVQQEEETARLNLIIILFGVLTVLSIFLYLSISRKARELKKQREKIDQLVIMQKEVIEVRTIELLSNEDAISQYTFLNAHELRAPLAKILNIVDVSSQEDIQRHSSLTSLKSGAEELEVAVRKINEALNKTKGA